MLGYTQSVCDVLNARFLSEAGYSWIFWISKHLQHASWRITVEEIKLFICNNLSRINCISIKILQIILIGNNIDCKHFLESNCLAVTIASLTSHDVSIRRLGYLVLAQYNDYLESASFKEKAQVRSLLMSKL